MPAVMSPPQQELQEGALVCLIGKESGAPLAAVKVGKEWQLHELESFPAPSADAAETAVFAALPAMCTFTLMRKGRDGYGFRSPVAEGRVLQAVADRSVPHRITNYNFGAWETWQLRTDDTGAHVGFVNCAFHHKVLDVDVKPLSAIITAELSKAQRRSKEVAVAYAHSRTELKRAVAVAEAARERIVQLLQEKIAENCSLQKTLKDVQEREQQTRQWQHRVEMLEAELKLADERMKAELKRVQKQKDSEIEKLEADRRELAEGLAAIVQEVQQERTYIAAAESGVEFTPEAKRGSNATSIRVVKPRNQAVATKVHVLEDFQETPARSTHSAMSGITHDENVDPRSSAGSRSDASFPASFSFKNSARISSEQTAALQKLSQSTQEAGGWSVNRNTVKQLRHSEQSSKLRSPLVDICVQCWEPQQEGCECVTVAPSTVSAR
eukprot:jgi/Chlat1/6372/Chrsp44S05754